MTKQTPPDPFGEIMADAPLVRPPMDEFLAQATPTMGRPPAVLTEAATDIVRPVWEMGQGVGAALQGNIGPEVGTGLMNTLGIFAGPGARTANRGALRLAEEMERRGMPREQIWDATGWFKGADKKWRFEIPDDRLRAIPGEGRGLASSAPIRHPELTKAYPEATEYTVARTTLRPGAAEGGFGWQPNTTPFIAVDAANPAGLRSGAVHELQHLVQSQEGFARGGTPESIRQRVPESVLRTLSPQERDDALHATYERLAGEVEARNVQTRLSLTPEARRRIYPWMTEDVPTEQQIVAGVRLVPVNHDPFK